MTSVGSPVVSEKTVQPTPCASSSRRSSWVHVCFSTIFPVTMRAFLPRQIFSPAAARLPGR